MTLRPAKDVRQHYGEEVGHDPPSKGRLMATSEFMATTTSRRTFGFAVAVAGWIFGIAFIAYGLLGIGVEMSANFSQEMIFARGTDPYNLMYLIACPVCVVMGVVIIRNLLRFGRLMRDGTSGRRAVNSRMLAGRLLLGVGAVWAAFTTLCVIVLPTTSELNPEFPWDGPVVLPIPDSLHGYLVPWRLPESMPWRLGIAVAFLALTVAAGVVVRYGARTTTATKG